MTMFAAAAFVSNFSEPSINVKVCWRVTWRRRCRILISLQPADSVSQWGVAGQYGISGNQAEFKGFGQTDTRNFIKRVITAFRRGLLFRRTSFGFTRDGPPLDKTKLVEQSVPRQDRSLFETVHLRQDKVCRTVRSNTRQIYNLNAIRRQAFYSTCQSMSLRWKYKCVSSYWTYGACRDFTTSGILPVKVLSVALDSASNSSARSDDTQQPPGGSASVPVTPAKRRKLSPSPPSSVASDPSPVAPALVSTTVHPPSNISVPSAFEMAPSGPMLYGHPFQHYPQHMSMAPFLPPLPYSMAGHPFPQLGFSANAPFTSRGEYIPPAPTDPPVLNSSADPSSSSEPGRSNDEESAFNKSAANPYSYPMTQIPPADQSALKHADHTSQGYQQVDFERTFNRNGIGITICFPRTDFWAKLGSFRCCDEFGCSPSSAARVKVQDEDLC
ncbi:hypothetical protein DFH09DRAFT_1079109 [Mycena vulgaris]|nr:hypothetical protein DFH09DRAFT_1079109 [Mycena vulgaris]